MFSAANSLIRITHFTYISKDLDVVLIVSLTNILCCTSLQSYFLKSLAFSFGCMYVICKQLLNQFDMFLARCVPGHCYLLRRQRGFSRNEAY